MIARIARPAGEAAIAALLGAAIALVGWFAVARVQWPAWESSNVLRALTTVGQVAALCVIAGAALATQRRVGADSTPRAPVWCRWTAVAGVAGLAAVTLTVPLGGTRLYLFGLSVDQQFRTEYLTRLTTSPRLADMTYPDMPPFYPAGWFWPGGRFAAALGLPGWEAYKPWAVLTIAAAAAVSVVLWERVLGRLDVAAPVAAATALLGIAGAAPEPYAAMLVLLAPPSLVVLWNALRRGGAASLTGSALFIGGCALTYTLYTGLFAATAVGIAVVLAAVRVVRARNPAVPDDAVRRAQFAAVGTLAARLAIVGFGSAAIALLVWAPYLARLVAERPPANGSAYHYLPYDGAVLPTPMLTTSLPAVLMLIGLGWIALRARTSPVAAALAAGVVAIYAWCLLSMAFTALGQTLLSFRLTPVLITLLGAGGVFGCVELARAVVDRLGDVGTPLGVLALAAAAFLAQTVPHELSDDITVAYTDTDGAGVRADQRPPGPESYFPQLDAAVAEQSTRGRDAVVLTGDPTFLSIHPYWGFNSQTSHYANPLGRFAARTAEIERWATLQTPAEFLAALTALPWPAPDVFLLRRGDDGYTLTLTQDVYPNDPNVKRYTVTFRPELFAEPHFRITEIGPFVLAIRR